MSALEQVGNEIVFHPMSRLAKANRYQGVSSEGYQTAAMPAPEIVADEDIGELEFALSEDDGDEIIEADDYVALADEQRLIDELGTQTMDKNTFAEPDIANGHISDVGMELRNPTLNIYWCRIGAV